MWFQGSDVAPQKITIQPTAFPGEPRDVSPQEGSPAAGHYRSPSCRRGGWRGRGVNKSCSDRTWSRPFIPEPRAKGAVLCGVAGREPPGPAGWPVQGSWLPLPGPLGALCTPGPSTSFPSSPLEPGDLQPPRPGSQLTWCLTGPRDLWSSMPGSLRTGPGQPRARLFV